MLAFARTSLVLRRASTGALASAVTQGSLVSLPGSARRKRAYFYHITHQGWLFLADAPYRNVATSFKDVKFLYVLTR